MAESAALLPPFFTTLGVWLGLGITLALFSLLLGDNIVARWAQHLLVGASMGYVVVATTQHLIRPRLIDPLLQGEWATAATPAALGLLLLLAAGERILRQSRAPQAGSGDEGLWASILSLLGVIPLALLLGTGLAVGLAGIAQGTLWPQTGEVLLNTWAGGRTGAAFWWGALGLLLTSATLLHLSLDRSRHVESLPRPFSDLMRAWVWIGGRALWFAAGILLARVFVSRFTIFYDRIDAISVALQQTGIGPALAALWTTLFGGG